MIDTNVRMRAPAIRHMPAAVKPIRMVRWLLWEVAGVYIGCEKGSIGAGIGIQPGDCDIGWGGVVGSQFCSSCCGT